MIRPTQPLRDEHCDLVPHLLTLLRVADTVGSASVPVVARGVDGVYEFLIHHLIPHAQAEDAALYPLVGRVLGAPEATATMSRDHVEVGRLTEQLAAIRAQLDTEPLNEYRKNELRRILYGLYALLKVHFAKEEEIYLPILDARVHPAEMRPAFEAMEAAAKAAKEAVVTG